MGKRHSVTLYAYDLMSNQFNMLLEVSRTPLAKAMQSLLYRYTRYHNQRYRKIGHLFQGRAQSDSLRSGQLSDGADSLFTLKSGSKPEWSAIRSGISGAVMASIYRESPMRDLPSTVLRSQGTAVFGRRRVC